MSRLRIYRLYPLKKGGKTCLPIRKGVLLVLHVNYWPTAIMFRVFAYGPEGQGSIPGQVIPKTQKTVLDASLLNTQHYKVWIKGKWSCPGKEVVLSPTPWCSNYWKGSLWVDLDYGWPTWLTSDGDLEESRVLFIAITLRSTLTWSSNTC